MSGSGYGKTVIDGVIQYLSPSGITCGDPTQAGGCERRWYYKYVLGLKEPFTGSQRIGVDAHTQIEKYLESGEDCMGQIARSARQFFPPLEAGMLLEHRIGKDDLKVAGIRVVGHIDLVLFEKNHVEVLDWKTTKSIKMWAKRSQDLIKTVQMALYAKWAQSFLGFDAVRISHVYMQTQGRPQADKRSVILSAEKIEKRWEEIEARARILSDIAKETDILKVPANRNACSDFKGCPRRNICPITTKDKWPALFAGLRETPKKTNGLSIIDELKARKTK